MLAALRGVLKESRKLGWMDAEDFQKAIDIPIIKATTLLRGRALTRREIIALQSACSRDSTPAGVRDAAIIGILYGTGLRRAEIINLDCSHYDAALNELTVFSGKGRKDRLVYVPDGTANAIKNWLTARGTHAGPLLCNVNKTGRIIPRRLTGQRVAAGFTMLKYDLGVARVLQGKKGTMSAPAGYNGEPGENPENYYQGFELSVKGAELVVVHSNATPIGYAVESIEPPAQLAGSHSVPLPTRLRVPRSSNPNHRNQGKPLVTCSLDYAP